MNLYDMLLPESPYVFYDVDHGFCINTEDVLNLIEQLQLTGHWIPCSERLPESMDFVLLTVRRDKPYNQRPFISVGYIDMDKTSWWCAHDGNCKSANVEVIAWMPLPEPYQEEGNQDE